MKSEDRPEGEKRIRPEKKAMEAEVREKLEGAGFVLLVDYQGLTVEKVSDFRGQLDKANARFQVVKNSTLTRAMDALEWDQVPGVGPTAVIFGDGEISETAKVLRDFGRANERPIPKGGRLGDQALTLSDVEEIANTPPREILLGRLVGTIAAPMTQTVGVLNQKLLSLLYALKAVETKKSEGK